jgi:hypothetical protein
MQENVSLALSFLKAKIFPPLFNLNKSLSCLMGRVYAPRTKETKELARIHHCSFESNDAPRPPHTPIFISPQEIYG